MIELDAQDFDELVKLLKEAEESVAALNNGDSENAMQKSRRALVSFNATAAMLGLESFEKAGGELETFLSKSVVPLGADSITSLGYAINLVIGGMTAAKEGKGDEGLDLEEIREILGTSQTPQAEFKKPKPEGSQVEGLDTVIPAEEGAPAAEAEAVAAEDGDEEEDLEYLKEKIRELGGVLTVDSEGDSGETFKVTFMASAETMRKIQRIVRAGEDTTLGSVRTVEESLVETVKTNVSEFIEAFSSADVEGAQKILLKLADQPCDSGLYKEIGTLARGLHDSILSFLNTLDPSLQEIVENTIPDSGNRLEHILEMTEKSALTTLDHVETMQARLTDEKGQISRLRELLGGLKAIGDAAGKKLGESNDTLTAMEEIIEGHRSDLDVILSAQDYQDLSGQIILKITKLLKDIEGKLVSLIRTFGVRSEALGEKKVDDLYGPAHAAVENAVHSQDEVDSLLSEFGF